MPLDPILIEDTRAWLSKASEDLRAARFELTAVPPLLSHIVFHAQQAAEKSLKAFLTWHDLPFRKTHNLEEIGEACLKLDASLGSLVDKVAPLTEYAWKYRYPGEPDQPTRPEAEEAMGLAGAVYEAVVARLPAEARP